MSNLIEFAQQELNSLLKTCTDSESLNMQKQINEDIMSMVKMFANQKHSGFSARYALNILSRVLNYKPIGPLTGADDEWVELDYDDRVAYQNKRCPNIFKTKSGRAYNSEGKIFSSDNGHSWYTCKDSAVDITFPYIVPDSPESIIIDNQKERQEIQENILGIISLNINEITDYNHITEDTPIIQLVKTRENIEKLEQLLCEKFNITDKIYKLTSNDDNLDFPKLYDVVSFVMKSDKQDKEEN